MVRMIIAISLGILAGLGILAYRTAKQHKRDQALAVVAPAPSPSVGSDVTGSLVPSVARARRREGATEEKPVKAEVIWVTGYVVRGQYVNVMLSDGRTITERDQVMGADGKLAMDKNFRSQKLLETLERNFVTLKTGEKYYLQRVAVAPRSQKLDVAKAPAGDGPKVVPAAVELSKEPQLTELEKERQEQAARAAAIANR